MGYLERGSVTKGRTDFFFFLVEIGAKGAVKLQYDFPTRFYPALLRLRKAGTGLLTSLARPSFVRAANERASPISFTKMPRHGITIDYFLSRSAG